MAERFATCSALTAYVGTVAKRAGLEDAATYAEANARGWKVTGMYFLAEGLDPSRATQTEATFDNLTEVKLMELRAKAELSDDGLKEELPQEFSRTCAPLVPMQKKLIELMRRGPAGD